MEFDTRQRRVTAFSCLRLYSLIYTCIRVIINSLHLWKWAWIRLVRSVVFATRQAPSADNLSSVCSSSVSRLSFESDSLTSQPNTLRPLDLVHGVQAYDFPF